MQRSIGITVAAGIGAIIGAGRSTVPAPIRRVPSESKRGRQMISKTIHSRSKYMRHQGKKERERAARCYMSSTFNAAGEPRCAPVMHQISKREFYGEDSLA